jgi:hypothetical protein
MFIYICIPSLLFESHYYQYFELLIILLLSIKVSTWFEFLYRHFSKQALTVGIGIASDLNETSGTTDL